MLAAVATVRNEADIIERTVRHLLAEGVDRIYIADGCSTDGTGEILDCLPVDVVTDDEPFHYQPRWIGLLSEMAAEDGCEWIIPFDADEFWYATEGHTLGYTLAHCGPRITKLHARTFQHRDWDHREVEYRSMGKVAFRWEPGVMVANGNHDVYLPSGGIAATGVLDLREWQFRSYEHMARKCKERVATLDPSLPWSEGTHQRVLAQMSEDELRAEWDRKQAVPVVYDPIPSRVLA